MAQVVIDIKEEDILKRVNRQRALQAIANSPFSDETLSILADWTAIPGAEEKILKNKAKLKLALTA